MNINVSTEFEGQVQYGSLIITDYDTYTVLPISKDGVYLLQENLLVSLKYEGVISHKFKHLDEVIPYLEEQGETIYRILDSKKYVITEIKED